ncbi:hypothetical protein PV325_008727 [Microctonus aethiopoides]|nr:hypothetical protein PV325_008727 [Microctonus aethiopoides]
MSGKNNIEKLSEIDGHVAKHYNIVRRLGKGAYGIVWKAVNKRTKKIVAMKKIFDAFRNQTDAQRTFREIMFLLSFANHENIIQLIGLHKANNNQDIYLVFEFMETDLHNVIKRGNILKDIHKVFIMYQLFKAIKYIHSGSVIHRDLKPSNILLNTQCHCKIADFGLARSVTQVGEGDSESSGDPTLTDYVATRWYRAPEILIASKRYTKGIDMWSLGCILGEMLLEKPLFPGSSTINQVERIMATLPPPTPEDIMSVSAGYGSNLLEKTPDMPRRTLRELFINVSESAIDLINKLIIFNPTHRLTAVEALEHSYVANFHHRASEPECSANVIPPLRDDVQLTVKEYRNKLYSMMDEKHRKYKNIQDTSSTEQTDDLTNKNSYFLRNDHGKVKKNESLKQSQISNHNERNPISEYACNLIDDKSRTFLPGYAKSYQGHSHQTLHCHHQQLQNPQQMLIKSRHPMMSNHTTECGLTSESNNAMNYLKLRRSDKPQVINRVSSSTIINNLTGYSRANRLSQECVREPRSNLMKVPNNVITKHFTLNDVNPRRSSSQTQVIHNYLNQTMPMVLRSGNAIYGSKISYQYNRNNMNEIIGDGELVTRCRTPKNHLKNTIHKSTTMHSINDCNQNHRVIKASTYGNLRDRSTKL